MTLTTLPLPDASLHSTNPDRVDVRPILTRSAENAWERTEQLRTELYVLVERLCRARGMEALVLQSNRYVHPAWVKFESWLPTGEPGVTARAAMTVTIATLPYRRFEAIYKVEWERHGQSGAIDSLYEFGESEVERLLTYLAGPPARSFGGRTVLRMLRPVQLRQSWAQFWKPKNTVRAVRRDWSKIGSAAAMVLGGALLIPALAEQASAPPLDPTVLNQFEVEPPAGTAVPSTGITLPTLSPIDGTPRAGSLDSSDERLDNGRIYEVQAVTRRAGEPIVVTMRSSDFDTFVTLGAMQNGSFVTLEANDDAGNDGTNSRLEFVPPTTGEYLVLFSSYEPGQTGSYTFTLP